MKYVVLTLCVAAVLASASPLAVTAVPLGGVRLHSRVPVARPETPFPVSTTHERGELDAFAERAPSGPAAPPDDRQDREPEKGDREPEQGEAAHGGGILGVPRGACQSVLAGPGGGHERPPIVTWSRRS